MQESLFLIATPLSIFITDFSKTLKQLFVFFSPEVTRKISTLSFLAVLFNRAKYV